MKKLLLPGLTLLLLPFGLQAQTTANIVSGTSSPLSGPAGNFLRINTPGVGTMDLGPQSTSYCSILTSLPRFYFDHGMLVSGGAVSSYSTSDLFLQTGTGTTGNTRIQVTNSTGNVMIGSGTATQKLQVDLGNLLVRGTSNYAAAGNRAYNYVGDVNAYMAAENGYGLHFGVYGRADFLNITQGGGVGIGLTNPSARLHVNATDATGIIVDHIATGDWGFGVRINANRDYTKAFGVYSSVTGANMFMVWGNGVVNAKKIYAEEINVTPSAIGIYWPDYVFSKDYKLRSLDEVEQFYTSNKHLPDVPSEKEVSEKGVAVGEMTTVLLRKVEELTLYVVEQQKKIDAQQAEIENLKKVSANKN